MKSLLPNCIKMSTIFGSMDPAGLWISILSDNFAGMCYGIRDVLVSDVLDENNML